MILAAVFNIIKALSFHNTATHSQPITPIKDKHKSTTGSTCAPLNAIAANKVSEAAHLTHQDRSNANLASARRFSICNCFLVCISLSAKPVLPFI